MKSYLNSIKISLMLTNVDGTLVTRDKAITPGRFARAVFMWLCSILVLGLAGAVFIGLPAPLTRHLLRFSGQARPLAPPEARTDLRDTVRRLVALYEP